MNPGPEPVIAAVRAYTRSKAESKEKPHGKARRAPEGWPSLILLLDTETTTDTAQQLRFGSYRLCRWEANGGRWRLRCLEEGLFYGDDLPKRAPGDLRALKSHVRSAFADVTDPAAFRIQPYGRREFVERVLWRAVSQGRALLCGFNLPFDLSRLAVSWSETRPRDEARRFAGGFSFRLWDWLNPKSGKFEENPFRPRLLIRHEDSKRARFAFGTCREPKMWDSVGKRKVAYRGRFLDVKTLAFALTGEAYSLASAAIAFGTVHRKSEANLDGPVTPEMIEYNRQDLRVTQELLEALREEADRHPIGLDPWQFRSPASLAKGYLRAAGITPLGTRAKAVPAWVHGAAMEAYYGGRTEYHAPRVVVPVVQTDFTSMYPTVQTLARLNEWLTAKSLHAAEMTEKAHRILASVTLARCLTPQLWPALRFLAEVEAEDDILPLRAQYDENSDGFTIGINHVTPRIPVWWTGFDIAASILLTGRVPRIRRAVTLQAKGRAESLKPVMLREEMSLDPGSEDVFRAIIEMRHRVKNDPDIPELERRRLIGVLKDIASSGSYGILAEMNPRDLPDGETRAVHVVGGSESFTCESSKPEDPGEYLFPPVAAVVTGGARLLLAVLEKLVTDAGGNYALCDTDSMAIIASATEGFVACSGGTAIGPNGEIGVRVLSWQTVREIVGQLDALKPYGSDVRESLLKIEDVNFEGTGATRRQIQLYAYGISAKRYCLFQLGANDSVEMVKASEHGLGHLLNPTDPEERKKGASGAPEWIEEIWRGFVLEALGRKAPAPPDWFSRPAVARHSFTSPQLLRPIMRQQAELPYADQVKPFNFANTGYIAPGGTPLGMEYGACHLITAYERDPRKWLHRDWYDTRSGTACRVSTREIASARVARVKSVADIVADYSTHAEIKSAGPDGLPAGPETVGLLARRHVEPVHFYRLGKETNRLEEVDRGEIPNLEEVQEIYEDPRRTAWNQIFLPLLKRIPARQIAEESGIDESLIHRYRKGTVRPFPGQLKRLIRALRPRLGEWVGNGAIPLRLPIRRRGTPKW